MNYAHKLESHRQRTLEDYDQLYRNKSRSQPHFTEEEVGKYAPGSRLFQDSASIDASFRQYTSPMRHPEHYSNNSKAEDTIEHSKFLTDSQKRLIADERIKHLYEKYNQDLPTRKLNDRITRKEFDQKKAKEASALIKRL